MKTKKLNKIQTREVIVREYEDRTYEIVGSAWNLDNLNAEEVEEAFLAWRRNKLKEECSIKIKPPRIIKKN